jgi:phosphoserine aminotransferase
MPTTPGHTTATGHAPADKSQRLYNFCAGPAVLPEAVLLEARDELPVYDHAGASVMEISHRSAAYDEIEAGARDHIRTLLGLSDDWHVLFLQGGASMQFHQVPLNLLPAEGAADYVVTGRWGTKAVKEARQVARSFGGEVRVAASSEDSSFDHIPAPSDWDVNPDAAYLHVTTNETVNGNQFPFDPAFDHVPVVTDASSEFLSRPMDLDGYGLIYAGAQKNIGPAGVTVVLVRDDLLARRRDDLPTMLDYGTHAAKRFNTPPVFPIYMVEKVGRWLRDQGGLPAIADLNKQKADLLYARIDRTDFYVSTVRPGARSTMNATFRIHDPELEPVFIREAEARGLLSLKGHRSVGGMRASMYNALPLAAVEALVDFMDAFEAERG